MLLIVPSETAFVSLLRISGFGAMPLSQPVKNPRSDRRVAGEGAVALVALGVTVGDAVARAEVATDGAWTGVQAAARKSTIPTKTSWFLTTER